MKKAFLYAFKHSIPILISFIPVGLAYGILMRTSGYDWALTALCCISVFAGSLQFLMIDFFSGTSSLISVTVIALLLNSRHIFYGLPFLDKWKDYGLSKLFLIYSLADESFSLHCSNDFDDGNDINKKWSYLFSGFLVLIYWVLLSIIGSVIGSLITFNTAGIDFALTGLFIVILIEQIKSSTSYLPAIIASVSSVFCLLVIGPDNFILPSLCITVMALLLLRSRKGAVEN